MSNEQFIEMLRELLNPNDVVEVIWLGKSMLFEIIRDEITETFMKPEPGIHSRTLRRSSGTVIHVAASPSIAANLFNQLYGSRSMER